MHTYTHTHIHTHTHSHINTHTHSLSLTRTFTECYVTRQWYSKPLLNYLPWSMFTTSNILTQLCPRQILTKVLISGHHTFTSSHSLLIIIHRSLKITLSHKIQDFLIGLRFFRLQKRNNNNKTILLNTLKRIKVNKHTYSIHLYIVHDDNQKAVT
jgi:hypothetical protein